MNRKILINKYTDVISNYMEWETASELYKKKKYADALKLYKEMEDKTSICYFNIACIFVRTKEYEKAIKTLLKALKIDNYLVIGYYNLAYCYYKIEQYQNAIACYGECLEQFADKFELDYSSLGLDLIVYKYDLYINKHICYGRLGQRNESQFELELAKKSYPGSVRVYSSTIKDIKKVFCPVSKNNNARKDSNASSTSSSSNYSAVSDPNSPKRIEFVYQGTSKVMAVPPNVKYNQLISQLSRKCGQSIEVFGMTDNDFLQIVDDIDLQALFQRSYIVLYCQ